MSSTSRKSVLLSYLFCFRCYGRQREGLTSETTTLFVKEGWIPSFIQYHFLLKPLPFLTKQQLLCLLPIFLTMQYASFAEHETWTEKMYRGPLLHLWAPISKKDFSAFRDSELRIHQLFSQFLSCLFLLVSLLFLSFFHTERKQILYWCHLIQDLVVLLTKILSVTLCKYACREMSFLCRFVFRAKQVLPFSNGKEAWY